MKMIKSCTDLSQSKTLSKILPLESADMHYSKDFDCSWFVDLAKYTSVKIPKYVGNIEEHLLPCWSLAALLSVLPNRICLDNEKYYLNYKKDKVEYLGPLTWDGQKCITSKANTLVDACYEMILKLHELNLL